MSNLNCFVLCGLSHAKRDNMVYGALLEYANKKALYIANKHDMSLEYCSMYIAEGLYFKYMELKAKKIESFGYHYNNVEYESFLHVLALVKKVLNKLNFACGGVYTRAHLSTNETEYLPNVLAVYYKSELIKNDIGSTKNVDIVDLIAQWENRSVRNDARLKSAMALCNACSIKDSYNVDKKDSNKSSRLFNFINDSTINNYLTPDTETIYNECIHTAAFYIKQIKDKKNFNKVETILKCGEKSNTDKSIIKRFKDRNGLQSLTFKELQYLFN